MNRWVVFVSLGIDTVGTWILADTINLNNRSYNLRNSNNFLIPRINTTTCRTQVFSHVSLLWVFHVCFSRGIRVHTVDFHAWNMHVMLQCLWPVLYTYIAYWSSNMIQIRYAHIKSSETLASFKNQVRRVDVENLLRPVTCATLRILCVRTLCVS